MNEKCINVGIIGAAGYTAGELIRILVNHPHVNEIYCQSNSQAGEAVSSIHMDLLGEFNSPFLDHLDYSQLQVVFLCKGHGKSTELMEKEHFPKTLKIIDLSHDFRLQANGNEFVYGLPEMQIDRIVKADKIANPGCFATCIQLGLLPAAAHDLINSDIHISGITGSTGAGQSLSKTSHFSWRNNNMSVYKAFRHQHLLEISESLSIISPLSQQHKINFIPYRGNFTRGIITTSYFKSEMSERKIVEIYKEFYKNSVFTHVTGVNPDLKQVVNTNKAVVYIEKFDDQVMIISMIDNLLKGASGQAVQNMNLMFEFPESSGLHLKASSF